MRSLMIAPPPRDVSISGVAILNRRITNKIIQDIFSNILFDFNVLKSMESARTRMIPKRSGHKNLKCSPRCNIPNVGRIVMARSMIGRLFIFSFFLSIGKEIIDRINIDTKSVFHGNCAKVMSAPYAVYPPKRFCVIVEISPPLSLLVAAKLKMYFVVRIVDVRMNMHIGRTTLFQSFHW